MTKKYSLYIDESGVANLCDYQSRFFILSAVAIEEKIVKELAAYFSYIKKRYALPDENNLHAVGLFEDKKSDFYLGAAKCKNFCKSVGEFIETSPFAISVSCLDKSILREILKMPDRYEFRGSKDHGEDKDIGYEILARKIFLGYAQFLKKSKSYGSITAESRRGADHRLLKTFLYSQEPNQFNHNSRLQVYAKELRDRVFSMSFENKKGLNAGLEIADLISYLVNKKVNRKLASLGSRGGNILWRAIEKRSDFHSLSPEAFDKFAKDRIHEIAMRIAKRLNANSDLVNPTRR